MRNPARFTTSWDDGHPLDARVADLLSKHELNGTFYVPRQSEHGVMSDAALRDLSGRFEIGAHTLNHTDLTRIDDAAAECQMAESKAWVESVTGRPCPLFCFPRGRFRHRHLGLARSSGFVGVRTTQLLSMAAPSSDAGLKIIPTTVQAFPHPTSNYVRNAAKRRSSFGLINLLRHGSDRGWTTLARQFASLVLRDGGVFHLWGHSWEIEQLGLWTDLENVMSFLGEISSTTVWVANRELCETDR